MKTLVLMPVMAVLLSATTLSAQCNGNFWKGDRNVMQISPTGSYSHLSNLNPVLADNGFNSLPATIAGVGVSFLFPLGRNIQEINVHYSSVSRDGSGTVKFNYFHVQSGYRWSFATIEKPRWNTYPFFGWDFGMSTIMLVDKEEGTLPFAQIFQASNQSKTMTSNVMHGPVVGWQVNREFLHKEGDCGLLYIGFRIEAHYPVNNRALWGMDGISFTEAPAITPNILRAGLALGFK